VCVSARVCVHVCVHACGKSVYVRTCVFAQGECMLFMY